MIVGCLIAYGMAFIAQRAAKDKIDAEKARVEAIQARDETVQAVAQERVARMIHSQMVANVTQNTTGKADAVFQSIPAPISSPLAYEGQPGGILQSNPKRFLARRS